MNTILWLSVCIFFVAIIMSMTGRGGGNFYVPLMVAFGLVIHEAAALTQLIIFVTAVAGMVVFHHNRKIDWKLALVIDPPTDVTAIIGGYYAHQFSSSFLTLIFGIFVMIAGLFMLLPYTVSRSAKHQRFGFWTRSFNGETYTVNLWIALPVSALAGYIAGMVGIAGGTFKVPLMVLLCGVPMHIAVGTSAAMVAVTALMGFIGHVSGGSQVDGYFALPFIAAALAGGFLGGRFSLGLNSSSLRRLFAFTSIGAGLFMLYQLIH